MPQEKDIFDQAFEELQAPAPAAAQAPAPAPGWQQNFQNMFPAQAQAAHQVGQAGQGLMQLAGSVSPLRFREGWDQPTLEVPEAVKSFIHPLDSLASMIGGVKQTLSTVGREAGALAAPNKVQAPSQPEMDQATRSATGMGAGLMAGPALAEGLPAVGGAIQGAATKAGIPQLMSEVADTPLSRVLGGRPIMRAAARRLYKVPEPTPPAPIDAQFVEPKGPDYQDVASQKIPQKALTAGSQQALPPAPPPGQIAGAPAQAQLGASMTHGPKALPAAPAEALPAGTEGVPRTADPRLPAAYANQPAAAPTAPPGMMVRGQIRTGEAGGIPKTGEQTVTPTSMGPHVAVRDQATGKFRKATDSEVSDFANRVVQSKSNVGKGPAPVEAPAPPPKKGKP